MANLRRKPVPLGVVFDFDGTLVDTVDLLLDTARVVLLSSGFEDAAAADLRALRDVKPRQALEAVGVPLRAVPGLARSARRELRRRAAEIELPDEVCQSIRRLHGGGVRLGIMSSNSRALIRSVIERAGIFPCFDFIARGGAVSDRGRRLRRVVRRHSARVERWVFVGDEIRDADGARACRVPFVGVGWGVARPEALATAGARWVASDWPELEETLVSLRSDLMQPAHDSGHMP